MNKEQKYRTILDKNTFYFYNSIFEETYESYINSLNQTLLVLKNKIEIEGLKKEVFEELLAENENGLKVLLALTGFANESLKRLITVARITNNKELKKLLLRDKWDSNKDLSVIKEWSNIRLENMIKENEFFRKGIVNLFFEGSTVPFLTQTLPLFELKKLSISKLKFEMSAMIDTLVRNKEKGSYSAKNENNPESVIETILHEKNMSFEKGDLQKLFDYQFDNKRTMDFIVPNNDNPQIIIECSFLVTTSSGQGDKSKIENSIKKLIQQHYPQAKFIGFIDGIGWYVRQSDLKRMVLAFDDVFTFHPKELNRFKNFIGQHCK